MQGQQGRAARQPAPSRPAHLPDGISSPAHHSTSTLGIGTQWSNPRRDGIEGDRSLEEHRLGRKPLFLMTLLVFVQKTAKDASP